MSSCTYFYRGKLFDSELELDLFILELHKFDPKTKDIVFLLNPKLRAQLDIIKNNLTQINNLKKGAPIDFSKVLNDIIVDESGEVLDFPYQCLSESVDKYIGVTSLIKEVRVMGSNGTYHLITPEFKEDNYWANKFLEYKTNGITDDEEFNSFKKCFPGLEKNTPIDSDILEKLREFRTELWKQLAIIGTGIHKLFAVYFSFDNRSNWGKPAQMKDILSKALDSEAFAEFKPYLEDSSENIINDVAKYCGLMYLKIKELYGEHAMIFPELKVVARANYNTETQTDVARNIIGQIDLLVIGDNGKSAIIDFKCSPKTVHDSAKKRTYNYQLALYRRMLQSIGVFKFTDPDPRLFIIPIQMADYEFDGEKTTVGKLNITNWEELVASDSSLGEGDYNLYNKNVDSIIPIFNANSAITSDVITKTRELILTMFPESATFLDVASDDAVKKYMEKCGGVTQDPSTKKYIFTEKNKDIKVLEANTKEGAEAEVFGYLKKQMSNSIERRSKNTKSIIEQLLDVLADSEKEFLFLAANTSKKDTDWVQNLLKKYSDGNTYKVLLCELEDQKELLYKLGIIPILNVHTHVVDVIKISSSYDPNLTVLLGANSNSKTKRHLLLGTYQSDVLQESNPDRLVMESTRGNIELMETMAFLNNISGNFKGTDFAIGKLLVMSVSGRLGTTASNEQIAFNWNSLCKLAKKDIDIENAFMPVSEDAEAIGDIKMCSAPELAYHELTDILAAKDSPTNRAKTDIAKILEHNTDFDVLISGAATVEEKVSKLLLVKALLEERYPDLKTVQQADVAANVDLEKPHYRVHTLILNAIATLEGMPLVQLVTDHHPIFEGSVRRIFKSGWNGSMLDNPGTLKNANLNRLSEKLNQAYQKIREELFRFTEDLRSHIGNLKKSAGYSDVSKYTLGNLTALYENMYKKMTDESGNTVVDPKMIFKNPYDSSEDLSDGERDFLKYALLEINKNRHPKEISSMLDLEERLIGTDPEEKFLKVPLIKGTIDSAVTALGSLLGAVKLRISRLSPKKWAAEVHDELVGSYTPEIKESILKGVLWEAVNKFDIGESDQRDEYIIRMGGPAYFELNLENLLLKHKQAYSTAKNLNRVFPLIQAVASNMRYQSITQNIQLSNDISYIIDFVKSKIFGLPMEDLEKWGAIILPAKKLMSAASKLLLAFSPHQWYQIIDGLWKDISLMIRKPDGETSFTFLNFRMAIGWIAKDAFHYGDGISLGEALNMTYGINDMDMNSLAERLSTSQTGLSHFWTLGFRFASRPDYYNRMAMFGAQMMGDGCFDAHSIVDGKLVYDWTKDKRFDVFAAAEGDINKASDKAKFKEQKALYYSMMKLFIKEGVIKEVDFDINKPTKCPLPRAYTAQQAESMKALADRIYGYYSHEKKSLIQSYTLGALFMQMATYWSSKKNQYFAGLGYTQEGHYVLATTLDPQNPEQTKPLFWKQDERGTMIVTEEDTGVPAMVWKGRPHEGIVLTMTKAIKAFVGGNPDTGNKGWAGVHDMWTCEDIDPDLRRLYRSNLLQLLYDLIMLLLLGAVIAPWLTGAAKEYIKERGNETISDAAVNTTMDWSVKMIASSGEDFNMIDSIFGKGVDCTPFAISQATNLASNMLSLLLSEGRDWYDAAVNTTTATKQAKPIFDYVKMNTLGRSIGDNGN